MSSEFKFRLFLWVSWAPLGPLTMLKHLLVSSSLNWTSYASLDTSHPPQTPFPCASQRQAGLIKSTGCRQLPVWTQTSPVLRSPASTRPPCPAPQKAGSWLVFLPPSLPARTLSVKDPLGAPSPPTTLSLCHTLNDSTHPSL